MWFIWLTNDSFLFVCQGSCIRMPPAWRGTQGSQRPSLPLERATCGRIFDFVWQDEKGHVCRGRSHSQNEDGDGRWKNGPCGISDQIHATSQDRRHLVRNLILLTWCGFCLLLLYCYFLISCVQVYIPHVWLHALSVWLHWEHHTLTVHQRVSVQVCHSKLMHFILSVFQVGNDTDLILIPIYKFLITVWFQLQFYSVLIHVDIYIRSDQFS